MFERDTDAVPDLQAVRRLLAAVPLPADDVERIDWLEDLERLKSLLAAKQAEITDALDAFQRALHDHARTDASIGAQVGLARRESPHAGRGHLGLARALLHDLPDTYAALGRGDLSERHAQIIAAETRDLGREDRLAADVEIARRAPGLGDVKLQRLARRVCLRLDAAAVTARRARAHRERRVTGRLLADGMAQVSLIVSDIDYAAIMRSLREHAALLKATGDRRPGGEDRSRGQLMADTAVDRLALRVTASGQPAELNLVMSAETLLADDTTPADLEGVGPIPASVARALVGADEATRVTVRRLFAFAGTDRLVAMESGRREFGGLLRRFVTARDQICRTPWCNAAIAHVDHIEAARMGGPTSGPHGAGLCEACNYLKEHPGWRHRGPPCELDQHVVTITTPTGHRHWSHPPGLPVPLPRSRLDRTA